MSKSRKISRRSFLEISSVFTGASLINNPMALLYENVVNGFVSRALAEDKGYDPRRYVYIQQPGAPSRWMFDLFLTPYSSGGFQENPMVGTRYSESGGRYTDVVYQTIQRKGIQVPTLWQYSVPRAGGGDRPMTDLLDNLLSFQGVSTNNAGHPGSQQLHFKPSGALRSLPALTGDYAPTPLAAIDLTTSNFKYDSLKGKASVTVGGGGNMLQTLLNPFLSQSNNNFKTKLSQVEESVEIGVSALDEVALSRHPAAEALNSDRKGAEELLRSGFPGLAAEWNSLSGKYFDLISRAIRPAQNLVGINDKPIGSTSGRDGTYALGGAANQVSTSDLRNLIQSSTVISKMAEHFAVAEYVLVNDLSRSVSLRLGTLTGLSTSGNTAAASTFDEHNSGKMPVLFLNAMYYRALAACLLEFIDQLKVKKMFDETVIDVGGEFNRSPRINGSGSDHGWEGASLTYYSGIIRGPLILGNLQNDTRTNYKGIWGKGAGITELAGQQIGLHHMAATLAALLRAPSPVTSTGPLVVVNESGVVPIIGTTKIIS